MNGYLSSVDRNDRLEGYTAFADVDVKCKPSELCVCVCVCVVSKHRDTAGHGLQT